MSHGARLVVVGLSHRTAPLALREQLAIAGDAALAELTALRASGSIEEILLVSTCNRVEVYATTHTLDAAKTTIIGNLARRHGMEPRDLAEHVYARDGVEAIRHLFRVAASLDSMVVGETQIVGQVRQALALARGAGMIGPVLGRATERAIGCAKRVLAETGLAEQSLSIASAAVLLAKKIFSSLEKRRILLVGAGKMAELCAKALRTAGSTELVVCNRHHDRALDLAQRHGGRTAELADLLLHLEKVDVAIFSTGAPDPLVSAAELRRVMKERRGRSLLIIDIAVPRNVDPAGNAIDGLFLYDVDDLSRLATDMVANHARAVAAAESIVELELLDHLRWSDARGVVPTIVALRERFHAIAKEEAARALSTGLGDLDAEKRRLVEELAVQLANRLLHTPTLRLKQGASSAEGEAVAGAARMLFDLAPPSVNGAPAPEEAAAAVGMPALDPVLVAKG